MARFRCPSHLILPALIVVGTGRRGSRARRRRPPSSATSSSTDQEPPSIMTTGSGEGTTSATMRCSTGAATPATVRPERRSIRCNTPPFSLSFSSHVCLLSTDGPFNSAQHDTSSPLSHPRRLSVHTSRFPSSPQRRRCPQAGTVSYTWSTSRATTARPPRTRSSPRSSATS